MSKTFWEALQIQKKKSLTVTIMMLKLNLKNRFYFLHYTYSILNVNLRAQDSPHTYSFLQACLCLWRWPWRKVSSWGRSSCSGSSTQPALCSPEWPAGTLCRKTSPSAQCKDMQTQADIIMGVVNTEASKQEKDMTEKFFFFRIVYHLVQDPNLSEFLLFERNLSIIADLPQGGPKAPLISCDTQRGHILYTLWSNPWDTMHTLCRRRQKSGFSKWLHLRSICQSFFTV